MCHNFNSNSKAAAIADVIDRLYQPTWGEFGEFCIDYTNQLSDRVIYTCMAFHPKHELSLVEEWQRFSNAEPDMYCNIGFRDVRKPYSLNSTNTYRVTDPKVLFSPRLERLYLFHQANFCMDGVP